MRQRGTSMLEFSLVAPLLLLILLGAYDLNRFLHVQHALRVAADLTLRCIYPTDPECLVPSSIEPPNRLFDWFQLDADTPYIVPLYNYSARATWHELPILQFKPRATVLGRVHYSAAHQPFLATRTLQDWVGIIPRFQRSHGLPRIRSSGTCTSGYSFQSGEWKTCSISSPCSCTSRKPSFQYEPSFSLELGSSKSTSSQTDVLMGTAVLGSIPSPYQSAPNPLQLELTHYSNCIDSEGSACQFGWPNSFPIGPAQEVTTFSYGVIWVTAVSPGPSATGIATMRLERQLSDGSWKGVANMNEPNNGQEFSGQGPHNFWPRGSHPVGTNLPDFQGGFSPEGDQKIFHGPIKFLFGKKYRLRFWLRSKNGAAVNFKVKRVHVWLPRYVLNSAHQESCPTWLVLDQEPNNLNCPHNPPYAGYLQGPFPNQTEREQTCAVSLQRASEEYAGWQVAPSTTHSCSGGEALTDLCPPAGSNNNFGFATYSQAEKSAICPTGMPALGTVSYSPKQHLLPAYNWIEDCLHVGPDPNALQPYREIQFGSPELIGKHPIPSVNAPDCAVLAEKLFNSNTPGLANSSYFSGPQPPLGLRLERTSRARSPTDFNSPSRI